MKPGWVEKRLEEIGTTQTGSTPKTAERNNYGDFIPFVKPADFKSDGSLDYANDGLTESGLSEARKVVDGSVLMVCIGATIGKCGYCERDITTNQQINALTPFKGVSHKFVYYQMLTESFQRRVLLSSGQATLPIINKSKWSALTVVLPPTLEEQQRIVCILDEAFEGIAIATANAEKNHQNARALFESHLQSVFIQRGKGWVDTKLEDVCGFQNGFAFKSSTFKPSGVPVIRISNIQDGRIDTENRLVFFDPKDYRENLDRYRIIEDDLLIAMSGATTGKLGFNTESTVFYLNQRVGKFEPGKKLNKRFLYHFLSTKVEENLRISAGAAQPNLSTEQIKGFVLPLAPIDEQARIVEALETLSEETQRLATLYERKLAALKALKKSLLHQAFTGVL